MHSTAFRLSGGQPRYYFPNVSEAKWGEMGHLNAAQLTLILELNLIKYLNYIQVYIQANKVQIHF